MIIFDYNKSYRKGKLICDESILSFIRNHFSVKNLNASFIQRKLKLKGSNAKVPEREYAIQESGMFDLGLANEIISFLRSEQLNDITFTPEFEETKRCGLEVGGISDALKHSLRDYQTETVRKALENGCGTIVVGTGGGKSIIQASLIENWKKITGSVKCLLIVPGVGLVNQLLKDFEDYGVSFTYSGWCGDMPKQDTEVIIVNTELLCSQFGNFRDLIDVDLILRDECHSNKQKNQITKIVSKIRTPNKFGFTGTLPKEMIDQWKIIGIFGPVIYEKNSKELRDEEYLTNVLIRILKLNHKNVVRGYKKELQIIQDSEERHSVIRKLTTKMNKNVLIMVNRLDHGNNLLDALQIEGKETFFVHGEMPVSERAEIITKMEAQDNIMCIAMSSIFSTGINIKNLHYIIFAAGGKSFIRIIQSIGRGLRLHSSKEKLVIFDLYDNFVFSTNHVEERKKFYDEEQIPWREISINI
jgi:superfamily II DNA or RNA helicase